MRSQFDSTFYWSKEIAEREGKRVFSYLWVFAGLDNELPHEDSYFIRNLAQIEVLFRRSNGRIVALENRCPHRMNSLFKDKMGRGPLVCQYHGWSFKSDGSLRKIPFENEIYKFSDSEKKRACLKKFATKTVGKFIFVNLDEKPIPFERQFSPKIIGDLELISASFDSDFERRVVRKDFNWKLAYENLRDPNHVRFVHPKTIATWTEFGLPQIPVELT